MLAKLVVTGFCAAYAASVRRGRRTLQVCCNKIVQILLFQLLLAANAFIRSVSAGSGRNEAQVFVISCERFVIFGRVKTEIFFVYTQGVLPCAAQKFRARIAHADFRDEVMDIERGSVIASTAVVFKKHGGAECRSVFVFKRKG